LFKLARENNLEGFAVQTVKFAKKETKKDELQIEVFLEGVDY